MSAATPTHQRSVRHEAARSYANDLDWAIAPLHTPDDAGACDCRKPNCGRDCGKHPRTKNGLLDATKELPTIDRWWRQWPHANVGIRTGEVSGIIVIDVDLGKDGFASLTALEKDHGKLPETVHSVTGSGGRHFFFRYPGRPVRNRANIASGIDVRGDGGYIVAPPSRHASGRDYRWGPGADPFIGEIAELPESWLELIAPAREERSGERPSPGKAGTFTLDELAIRAAVDALSAHYVEGVRHELTLALAGWLAQQGYDEESVGQLIAALADDDDELEKRLRNAATTFERLANGEIIIGWQRLGELLPRRVLQEIEDLLGTEPEIILGANRSGMASPNGAHPPEPPEFGPETAQDASEPAPAINLTDLGNARRLVRLHGRDLRYCYLWNKWLVWDGARWKIDTAGTINRRAKRTVATIYAEAAAEGLTKKEKTAIAAWAIRSEAAARIEAMIKLAESEPGIPVQPDELDVDPWLLNVENGVLDLRTGELLAHDRARLITKLAPVRYEPAAEAPTWDAFLETILEGKPQNIAFVQRAIGYALTGRVTERKFFVLHGPGRNGKGTLLNTVLAVLGDYAMRTPAETLMASRNETIPNDIARLKGARFVFASETEEGRRLAVGKVKDITGDDVISARFMRAEWFDFHPEFKLFLGTNHRPNVGDAGDAMWDRIRLIPFNVRISDEQRDGDLKDKLFAERAGILRWALDGCLAWQQDGLGEPIDVMDATKAYRRESDLIGQFIDDRCLIGETERATAKDLYAAYTGWCEAGGEKPMTQTAFGKRLAERGFDSARDERSRYWIGISIASSGASGK